MLNRILLNLARGPGFPDGSSLHGCGRGRSYRPPRPSPWRSRRDPDDDQSGYRLGEHRFVVGEYVTIRDEDGHSHTLKVVEVEPIASKGAKGGRAANEAV
jgi:hypothetical protein